MRFPTHVKWFSDFDFADAPRNLAEIATPMFFVLATVAALSLVGIAFVDRRVQDADWYRRSTNWLSEHQTVATDVMRLTMAGVLVVAWQQHNLLAPELPERWGVVGWIQLIVALAALSRRTVPLAGVGLIVLWLIAVGSFGAFHMLDYAHVVGIGVYLAASHPRFDAMEWIGLPALYMSVGAGLIWAALEKLVYPGWSLAILESHPALVLGVDPEFFLLGAAFLEISLGFLLLVGLVERPLAALITVVFFTTTLVFGRTELVGHAPLHAALIVFLLAGPSRVFGIPSRAFTPLRAWAVPAKYTLVLAAFLTAYLTSAHAQFEHAVAEMAEAGEVGEPPP